jgi:hypothetical protein
MLLLPFHAKKINKSQRQEGNRESTFNSGGVRPAVHLLWAA